MMILLAINGIDYTEYVSQRKYKVNREDVYGNTKWTDANYVSHRSVVRTKISGSMVLSFSDQQEFRSFVSHVESTKVAGYNLITVYVNNLDDVRDIKAYLEVTTNTALTVDKKFGFASVALKIEEK